MIDPSGIHEFRIQLRMATDTVIHDYLRALVDRLYHLRFPSHHEYRGVAHSVHTFEDHFFTAFSCGTWQSLQVALRLCEL